MFMVEQFIDDFTLNVTKEGYMFLTVKQAVEFLKKVDEDKVSQEGYLLELIENKKKQLAQRQIQMRNGQNQLTMIRPNSGQVAEMSFNILSNPLARD